MGVLVFFLVETSNRNKKIPVAAASKKPEVQVSNEGGCCIFKNKT